MKGDRGAPLVPGRGESRSWEREGERERIKKRKEGKEKREEGAPACAAGRRQRAARAAA